MKKAITILLALVMVLSLAACGGGSATTTTPEPVTTTASPEPTSEPTPEPTLEPTPEPEPEPEQVVLHLNETIEWGNYELTIIDVRMFDKNGFSVHYSTGGQRYGGPSVGVTYTLKNIGKTAVTPPMGLLRLYYADGYSFTHDLFVMGYDSNIYASGGTNTSREMDVLSSEKYFLEAFTVPEQVMTDVDSPLFLTLAYADSAEESPFRYDIRPLDEIQTEALYQQGVAFLEEGTVYSCYRAMQLFEELGEYKDSENLLVTATEKESILAGNADYLLENIDDYPILTGDEISEIIVGEWMFSWDGMVQWTFQDDGVLDDHAGHDRVWRVEGNHLLITTAGKTTWECEMHRVKDYGYFLVYEIEVSGKPQMTSKTMYPME